MKYMTGINFQIIPHEEQRYPTPGDWWCDDEDVWQIRVSALGDWRYEFLIFFHEVLEMAWCRWKGIREEDVTAFDERYEENRRVGDLSEPGNDPKAPYWFGHQVATLCERSAAHILNVDWNVYDAAVNAL